MAQEGILGNRYITHIQRDIGVVIEIAVKIDTPASTEYSIPGHGNIPHIDAAVHQFKYIDILYVYPFGGGAVHEELVLRYIDIPDVGVVMGVAVIVQLDIEVYRVIVRYHLELVVPDGHVEYRVVPVQTLLIGIYVNPMIAILEDVPRNGETARRIKIYAMSVAIKDTVFDSDIGGIVNADPRVPVILASVPAGVGQIAVPDHEMLCGVAHIDAASHSTSVYLPSVDYVRIQPRTAPGGHAVALGEIRISLNAYGITYRVRTRFLENQQ